MQHSVCYTVHSDMELNNTHRIHRVPIAKQLHKHAKVLHYTYIAHLVKKYC
jgi:hypothetical protein